MVDAGMVDAINNYVELLEDSSSLDTVASVGGAILGAFIGIGLVVVVIALIVAVLSIVANWIIFKKAGEKGWKAIIPIYRTITLFKIAGVTPWLVLGYLAGFIPWVGGLICVAITIYVCINLAKAFGKGDGFTVGLILLNAIFMMILAFGSSEYQLNKKEQEIQVVEE